MSRTWQENAGLLALRVGVGGVLVAHGVQKLFGWLGGHGLEGTGAAFEQMGFQPGRQSALAAGLGEAGGGLAHRARPGHPRRRRRGRRHHAPRGDRARTTRLLRRRRRLRVPGLARRVHRGPGALRPGAGRWTPGWAIDSTGPGWRLPRCWAPPRSRSRSCNVAAGYSPPAPNSRAPRPERRGHCGGQPGPGPARRVTQTQHDGQDRALSASTPLGRRNVKSTCRSAGLA